MKPIKQSQSKKAHVDLQLNLHSKKDLALKNRPVLKPMNKHTGTKGSK